LRIEEWAFSNASSAQENADFAKVERREVFVGGGFAAHKNPYPRRQGSVSRSEAFSNALINVKER